MIKSKLSFSSIMLIFLVIISAAIWYISEYGNRGAVKIEGGVLWTYKTNGSIVSTPAFSDLDDDGLLEVIVGSGDGNVYVLNGEDGSLLWRFATGGSIHSSPAVGDLDNDGFPEIVFGSNDGNVYALNGEDGSLLWNYSVKGLPDRSPSIADLDGDGIVEVVFVSNEYSLPYLHIVGGVSYVYVVGGADGELVWFRECLEAISSPAVGDLNGDGILDVAVYNSIDQIYVFSGLNGSLLWSEKFHSGYMYSASLGSLTMFDYSPVLGDINNDGKLELIPFKNRVNVFSWNGELLLDTVGNITKFKEGNFYYKNESNGWGIPALGDVDKDGDIDIVSIGVSGVYIYVPEKQLFKLIKLWDFSNIIVAHPSLADFTGDKTPEIVAYDTRGYIAIVSGVDGDVLWSIRLNNSTEPSYMLASPTIGDIDGDGDLDIVVCDKYGYVYGFSLDNQGSKVYWQALRGTFMSERNLRFIYSELVQGEQGASLSWQLKMSIIVIKHENKINFKGIKF